MEKVLRKVIRMSSYKAPWVSGRRYGEGCSEGHVYHKCCRHTVLSMCFAFLRSGLWPRRD